MQSSGRKEITGANVLVAIFSERESNAVYYLNEQDMTRFDAVNYISHDAAKDLGLGVTRDAGGAAAPCIRSRNLNETVSRGIGLATERQHNSVTLEHLLLALTDDPDALAVLQACQADLDELRSELFNYLNKHLDHLVSDSETVPRQAEGVGRALQRAAIHAQSSGREDVTGADVLVAIFSERKSLAVYFLREQNMTRSEAVTCISAMRGQGCAP